MRTIFDVGYSPAQPYPFNEYEQGEALFHSARFSSEALPSDVWPTGTKSGDKSCNHCHRETLTDGKVWQVGEGLLVETGGQRMPPAARNIRDTMPLFWEGVQTEADFDLESSEFSPHSDFDCEEIPGDFNAPCAARDDFFRMQTAHLDPLGAGFDFQRVARELIGAFLIGRPRLLPNPVAQYAEQLWPERAAAFQRGFQLFHSDEVGCSSCHPSGNPMQPFTVNTNIAPVIPPSGLDLGLTFKDEIEGNFNVPSIRGVWDRPKIFFHDGRAKSIKSAILPTGHPSLVEGVDGCHLLAEESDKFLTGVVRPVFNGLGCNQGGTPPLAHGGTANLTPAQVDDLLEYVEGIQ